ncbi:MAG: hypothetical protein M8353_01075 [ANME-2 cluster archaeon]|nr:hypothetical protein [ANME-2 cluster archaeon]
MMSTYLFFGIILIYLAGAALSIILHKKDRICMYASFVSSIIASILGTVFSLSIIFKSDVSFELPGTSLIHFGFFIDKLSAFFILVISITVFAVSIYSLGYVKEYFGKKNIGYLGFLNNTFVLSMILVTASANALFFLIAWELMSVLSYFLVIYDSDNPQTRNAGLI